MKFLHTSDWHLGRVFHGHDLLADQQSVLAALADLARAERADAVLLSGDIYDRAIPSAEAVGVATRAVQGIRDAGAQIVAISGNHDSAARLGAFAGLLAAGGLHVRTEIDALDRPVVFGSAGDQVAVYGIPYLEPDLARHQLGLAGPASHHAVLRAAMDRVRVDLASRPGCRSVVLAHAFVVGAAVSGSERSIAVGGVESVGADVFDGIDYVALGHLHTPQRVSDGLRYSGSVLPYSFGEAGAEKGVWLVDVPASGPVQADWRTLPVVRPLAKVRGDLIEILMGHSHLADHYLAVELTDPVRPIDPMRRLRESFPFTLTVTWQPPQPAAAAGYPTLADGTSDRALLDRFIGECRGGTPSDGESALLDRAVSAGRSR